MQEALTLRGRSVLMLGLQGTDAALQAQIAGVASVVEGAKEVFAAVTSLIKGTSLEKQVTCIFQVL